MAIIVGLNKYTHTTAACLMDADDGQILFANARERLTRVKGQGGDVAEVVEAGLDQVGATIDDVALVVQNNHLFAIGPFEVQLPYYVGQDIQPATALERANFAVYPGSTWSAERTHEISHHLAHAYAAIAEAPFRDGLIVVMDGIGNAMADMRGPSAHRKRYTTDDVLPRADGFVEVPAKPEPHVGYREGETVYLLRDGKLSLLFKRWTRQRSPEILHNGGFENHESVGAVYSRASSHTFGTWNACGKVMGLSAYGTPGAAIITGPLASLTIDWPALARLAGSNEFDWHDDESSRVHRDLAATVQRDVEGVVLPFIAEMKAHTGATNLAFLGGVALNSLLNGRIVRELGFEQVYIPPYPGDDGIAVGCARFGFELRSAGVSPVRPTLPTDRPAVVRGARREVAASNHGGHGRDTRATSPYFGRSFSADAIDKAIDEFEPWIDAEQVDDDERLLERVARELADGSIVGWFQGRSEFGPRALGNRSILAHPGPTDMRDRINVTIKRRETFRPFAPTVLSERVADWFVDADRPIARSPFMSLTLPAHDDKRARIPAVVHVDGSGRLQTLRRDDNPRYYALIGKFAELTGVPMLLNTSFNIGSEPIVDSPRDAVRALLRSNLNLLALEDRLVTRRPFPSGRAVKRAQPSRANDVLLQVVSDAEGEIMRVTCLHDGDTHELNELASVVWDFIADANDLADLFEAVDELGVTRADATDALRALFARQLIQLDEPAPGA